ncbi:MAG: NUDIX domain-containing protein [Ignavibacteriaceae bacterium]
MTDRAMQGAALIIINNKNEILLMLRDNIPEIPFPDMWDIPGGHVELNEVPEQTIKREMMEEMGFDVGEIHFFRKYGRENLTDNIFWKRADLNPDIIILKEGQRIKYFSREEIKDLHLAFNYNEVLEDFFNYIESKNE